MKVFALHSGPAGGFKGLREKVITNNLLVRSQNICKKKIIEKSYNLQTLNTYSIIILFLIIAYVLLLSLKLMKLIYHILNKKSDIIHNKKNILFLIVLLHRQN